MKTIADDRVRERMRARLESLSLGSPRRWGRMNVQQMLSHLAQGMEMVLRGEALGASRGRPRRWMKVLFLDSPAPWPKGVRGARDPAGADVPASDFESLRDRVVAGLDAMATWEKPPETAPHPGFGHLSTLEWQRWAYRHAHHHLRQFSA